MLRETPIDDDRPKRRFAPFEFDSDREFNLRQYVLMLWRHKSVLIGSIVLVTGLTILIVFQLQPQFTAEALVMVDVRKTKVVDMEAVMSGLDPDKAAIESEVEILKSRALARKVIDELNLFADPEFNAALRPKSTDIMSYLNPLQYIPASWMQVLTGREKRNFSPDEERELHYVKVVNSFESRLSVTVKGRSFVIEIKFVSEDPNKAARIVNNVAELYLDRQRETKFDATRRATMWIEERLVELRETLKQSEQAVEEYRDTNSLVESRDGSISAQQLAELNSELVVANAERVQLEARLNQMRASLESDEPLQIGGALINSPLIDSLRQQETEVLRRQAELGTRYGERHPKMINIRAEYGDIRAKIELELRRVSSGMADNVVVARARERALRQSLDSLKSELGRVNETTIGLVELQRVASANRTLYENYLSRLRETSEQELIPQADARIISLADPPVRPSFPDKPLFVGVALVGSIILGVMLILVMENLDRGFRNSEQIEAQTEIPMLGMVPLLKASKRGGATPEEYILDYPTSALSEAIRELRTVLALSNVDDPPKVILVTSSVPGEGKTFCAVSLARLAAQSGQRVILVECDLRRPRVQHALGGVVGDKGLLSLLEGDSDTEEFGIYNDSRSGLHFVPAIRKLPNPSDVLGSEHMKRLVKRLKNSYDLVVLDAPPVLAVSDALVLSQIADTTLYVVRWEKTPRTLVLDGLRVLSNGRAQVCGSVLCQVDIRKHAQYGYGDRGYFYRQHREYYS